MDFSNAAICAAIIKIAARRELRHQNESPPEPR